MTESHNSAPTLPREEGDAILRALQGMTLHQARQVITQCIVEDGTLSADDVQTILKRKVQAIKDGGLLEYYPLEDNRFELGGFANLKSWLERAKVGFTAEAKALNLAPPRGLMLVGVPGCGKSLAAKAIAREWQLPLLKLDAGRLFDKFVGESEKNFRKAIEMAESLSPIVLWIDEIEKAMVAGGGSGDADAGLSRRLFGAFFTWLQEKKTGRVRGGHGEQSCVASTGTAAQRPVRRNLLRGLAGPERARSHLEHSPQPPEARHGPL